MNEPGSFKRDFEPGPFFRMVALAGAFAYLAGKLVFPFLLRLI